MDDQMLMLVVVGVLVLLIVAAIAWTVARRKRAHLKQRFGPEYDHVVREQGAPAKAEAVLAERQRRVESLEIRPIEPAQRDRFSDSWRRLQAQFVDDPRGAVTLADRLVGEVMSARGYPVGEFEQRAADISVHHPLVVEHFRAARDIALRHARGQASTEDLRQAMVHYRELFSDLLESRDEHENVPVQPRRR